MIGFGGVLCVERNEIVDDRECCEVLSNRITRSILPHTLSRFLSFVKLTQEPTTHRQLGLSAFGIIALKFPQILRPYEFREECHAGATSRQWKRELHDGSIVNISLTSTDGFCVLYLPRLSTDASSSSMR